MIVAADHCCRLRLSAQRFEAAVLGLEAQADSEQARSRLSSLAQPARSPAMALPLGSCFLPVPYFPLSSLFERSDCSAGVAPQQEQVLKQVSMATGLALSFLRSSLWLRP